MSQTMGALTMCDIRQCIVLQRREQLLKKACVAMVL